MSAITRLIVAAVRANPALAAALVFEAGILLMRAIQKNTGRSPVGKSAKTIETALLANRPEALQLSSPSNHRTRKPRKSSRSRRRSAA